MGLSKAKIKQIKALHLKKYRKIYNQFLVEGEKSLVELINSNLNIEELYITSRFKDKYKDLIKNDLNIVTEEELLKAGTLGSNNSGIAVVNIPENTFSEVISEGLNLYLDAVRDPGNLGTIIRIADWYGLNNVYCSLDTADIYNPKTLMSTMGSFTRVNVVYVDLNDVIEKNPKLELHGALMSGDNLHDITELNNPIMIVMGNESNGINEENINRLDKKITIPKFGNAESLNVGVATSIILDNYTRITNG